MHRKEGVDWKKIKSHVSLQNTLFVIFSVVSFALFFTLGRPVFKEFNESFAMKEFKEFGIITTYKNHYHFFFDSIQSLADADISHDILVRQISKLQKELEIEKTKNVEKELNHETQTLAQQLKTEAGSHVAKVPDGIEYEAPSNILPHQLLVLGMEYFRKKDFEKSAVIFHELTHLKEDAGFKRPDYFLISAISWYQLKHFEMAQDYLQRAEKSSVPGSVFYRESILWQSIVEHSRGNRAKSQNILTRLISLYPESEEVAWVNQKLHKRLPATEEPPVHAEPAAAHTEAPAHGEHTSHE